MKDFDRQITLLCPLCGNNQFESPDEEFEDLLEASDNIRVRCSDCGSEYTKEELLDGNSTVIDNAAEEMEQDIINELEKDLEKALKGWKI